MALLGAMASGLCAAPVVGSGTLKMLPAEDYPHAGLNFAVPQGFEMQTVSDPFDVARAVLSENNKPVHAITISAYPIAEKVKADQFADAMMADLGKVLAVSKLNVTRKPTLPVAGVDAQVRTLSYDYRGVPATAIKVFLTREEKHAGSPDGKVHLCYVLTAESSPERQGAMAAAMAEVVKTVKFVPLQQVATVDPKALGAPIRDYEFRPPAHWYARLTPSGVEAGLTDYILGGVPMPLLRIAVAEPPAVETAEQVSKKLLETLKQNAAAEGQELKTVSQGASTLGPLDAQQVVLSQGPTSRPVKLKPDEEPSILIAYRTTGVVEVTGRLPRTYWLAVYCQTTDQACPLAILKTVSETFQVLVPASVLASMPASSSGPATGPATSSSCPASGPGVVPPARLPPVLPVDDP
jgi:hypothetical protein